MRKKAVATFTSVERAYAAGLIDGEGCIGVTRRGVKGGIALRPGQHTLGVWVSNTALPMLTFLHSRWGGCVVHRKGRGNSKEQWCWMLPSNGALRFLDDIYEFLIVKKRQAQLGRRFQRYVQVVGRKRTDKIFRLQSRFYDEFKILNHRGTAPPLLRPN